MRGFFMMALCDLTMYNAVLTLKSFDAGAGTAMLAVARGCMGSE